VTDARAEIERMARRLERPDSAVIGTDLAGRILFWNEGAERLYGWPAAEVMGRDILEVTPTALSKAEAAEIMSSLQAGWPWSGRFVVQDRAARRFLAEVTDIPVRSVDGSLVGIVGVSKPAQATRG
jgi:PAS domain S-box-containing protein